LQCTASPHAGAASGAASLLMQLEEALQRPPTAAAPVLQGTDQHRQASEAVSGWLYCGGAVLSQEGFVTHTLAQQTASWIYGNPDMAVEWLQQLSKTIASGTLGRFCPEAVAGVLPIVCAAMVSPNSCVRLEATAGLLAMAGHSRVLALPCFSFCMYRLDKESNPAVHLALLRGLADCALDRVTAAAALNAINRLAEIPPLLGVALDLMYRLICNYPRMFPNLLRLLVERNTCQQGDWSEEACLARATAVFKVCTNHGHIHGVEMVPAISDIVCNYSSNEDAVALALAGLCKLIDSSVVDVKSAWKILGSK